MKMQNTKSDVTNVVLMKHSNIKTRTSFCQDKKEYLLHFEPKTKVSVTVTITLFTLNWNVISHSVTSNDIMMLAYIP